MSRFRSGSPRSGASSRIESEAEQHPLNGLGDFASAALPGTNFAPIARGSTAATSFSYDAASRLQTLAQNLAGTSDDQTYTYIHNAAGQTLSRAGSNSAYNWPQPALGYDDYDPNRLNQYAAVDATSFSYDGRGNLTNDGTTAYTYDVYNRLTAAGGYTLSYDPAGRLYQTGGSVSIRRYVYDGVERIAEYNTSGAVVRRFVPGPSMDEPVTWYEGAGTSTRRWFIQDELGSVVAVTNSSGTAWAINSYDEYGRPASTNNVAGRFQYTGQIWLEAGLYHYKARAYSPALGRFMQTDPILYRGGMNLYAYVGNDPVNFVDPRGSNPLGLEDYVKPQFDDDEDCYWCVNVTVCPEGAICEPTAIESALRYWRQIYDSFAAPLGQAGEVVRKE